MKLYEFDSDIDEETILSGVVGQIYNRSRDTGFDKPYSLKVILDALSKRGINIDRDLFIKMIEKPPLDNIIHDIRGDNVIFKGMSDDQDGEEQDADKQANTLEKMADRAGKNRPF
jgi:hypothetical protein